jgi:hypothetical protein
MKRIILVITAALFVYTYNLNAQQTMKVSDEPNSYTIEIPAGWVHATSKNAYVSVLMCSDTVNTGERLSIIDAKNSYNLEKANKVNQDAFKKFKNFKVSQEGDGTLGGQPCKWFEYTFTSDDGNISMKGKYYTVKNSGRGFSIQYVLKQDRFDIMKDTFEKCIGTFKFN